MVEGQGIEVELYRRSNDPLFVQILQQHRLRLFSQINEIVFYGKGGYDFNTIYTMPVWLRRFTYKEMVEAYKREAEATEAASKGESQSIKKAPNVRVPDYSIKRSAK